MIIEKYNMYDVSLNNKKIYSNKLNIITGRNGIGKSVLLNQLSVEINESNILMLDSILLDNLTFQENYLLWKNRYYIDNCLYEKLISEFKLEKYSNEKINTLSTGTKRKIELAFFISKCDKKLLIDEPLAFLDDESIYVLLKFLVMEVRKNRYIIIADQNIDKYSKYLELKFISEIKLEQK